MFIFIWTLNSSYCNKSNIYIPLCLYLYFTGFRFLEAPKAFTFHYVYIYILAKQPSSYSFLNLHSTMFIFISNQKIIFLSKDRIYIPLCLYLYFCGRVHVVSWQYLHSTMFIFISLCTTKSKWKKFVFTFHYVYIYMDFGTGLSQRDQTFTFHYVYIYMVCVKSI